MISTGGWREDIETKPIQNTQSPNLIQTIRLVLVNKLKIENSYNEVDF